MSHEVTTIDRPGQAGSGLQRGTVWLIAVIVVAAALVVAAYGATRARLPLFASTGTVDPAQEGWSVLTDSRLKNAPGLTETFDQRGYHVKAGLNDYRQFAHAWPVNDYFVNVIEIDVQLVANDTVYGVYFGLGDTQSQIVFSIEPDGVKLYDKWNNCALVFHHRCDTRTRMNTYRATIEDGVARLYLNDHLVCEEMAIRRPHDLNGVTFGVGSSVGSWKEATFGQIVAYRKLSPRGVWRRVLKLLRLG